VHDDWQSGVLQYFTHPRRSRQSADEEHIRSTAHALVFATKQFWHAEAFSGGVPLPSAPHCKAHAFSQLRTVQAVHREAVELGDNVSIVHRARHAQSSVLHVPMH
jgi:hypothetical protein